MKSYNEYMDNIHFDPELQQRLMARLAGGSTTRRVKPLVALAAGAALVFAAVWVLHVGSPPPGPGPDPIGLQDQVTIEGGTLYFSQWDKEKLNVDAARIMGYFQEEMEPSLVAGIFSGEYIPTDFVLTEAWAGYDKDGGLVDFLIAYSNAQDQLSIRLDHFYGLTQPLQSTISVIHGTEVIAGYWPQEDGQTHEFFASFKGAGTKIVLKSSAQVLLAEAVEAILAGEIDFTGITPRTIPHWHYESLTLNQARADEDFGSFVPATIPQGFSFSSGLRYIHQDSDFLWVSFAAGMNYIELSISRVTPQVEARIIDISQRDTYDMSLYPIPWAESVPDELRDVVIYPVFRAEDMSLDVLRARAYSVQDAGDTGGERMQFSILRDGVVVDINVKGAGPQEVISMLQSMAGLR